MKNVQTHFRTCNLCEAMCGLEINYSENKIISIKGDKNDVFSKGHICPKAVALKDVYYDQDRLKTPIKKTINGWQQISWEEAFDEVTEKLKTIQKSYGTNAVGVYRGNPNVHNLGLLLYSSPFIKSLQTQQKYSATSVDQLPHHIASLLMFGHQMMIPIPDIDNTDFMLIMGGNPAVSNGSMMTAPNFSKRIKDIIKRGGKVINVDPRFTETSKICSAHHSIKPGKDALLLLSLIHVIFDEKLDKKGHLASHCNGWDEIEKLVRDYPPKKTAALIGIQKTEIIQLARDFSNAESAVCYGRLGLSTQEFGGMCQWLVNVLNAITGNLDTIGGAMFTLPAIDLVGMAKQHGKTGTFNRKQSRVHKLPQFTGEFPVATLADEILTEGDGQIKAMITIAGNPVLSTPNGRQLEKAFEKLEYMVAIDIYINETSRFADIILPSTTGLETAHYDLAFHQLAIRNTAKYNDPLFDKENDQRHDWEVLNTLTEKMTGQKNPATPEMMLDHLLQYSPYKDKNISIKMLRENPHGIDFGPLQSCLPNRLFTNSKKVELAPQPFLDDLNRLKKQISIWQKEVKTDYPFVLIGRRHLRNNNSWMHNSKLLMTGRERCTLLMHPEDAQELHLNDLQKVTISSHMNSVQIPIEITNEMRRGVVSMPHGFGHNRKGIKLKLAQEKPGVSINDLTDNTKIDTLTGNADFSGTRVKIEA